MREVEAGSEAGAGAGAGAEGVGVEVEAVLMKLSRRSGCIGGDDLIDSVARDEEE